MKKLFIPLMITLMTCCTSKPKAPEDTNPKAEVDPKVALIAEYVQTIGNTKTDLGFEMLKLERGKDIIAKDSLIMIYNALVNDYEGNLSVDGLVAHLKPYYEKYPEGKAGIRYKALSKYYTEQDRVIGKGYNCKYKIKNPMLNMAVQEITQTFYFSPDESKVLASK